MRNGEQELMHLVKQVRPKLCVDDFSVLRRIGEGSFGQVFRVRKRDTKRICTGLSLIQLLF